jgi:predicted transposase YdaD
MSVMAQEREQGRLEGRAEGRAEGEAQGKARGKTEGKAETLLRLLERRFHDVPETYRAQVLAAGVEQLDAWIDAVLDAPSVDAIFVVPTAH